MNNYRYKAITLDGRKITGRLQANDKTELVYALSLNDEYLVQCRKTWRATNGNFLRGSQLKLLNDFSTTLSLLLKANVPLLDALRLIVSTENSSCAGLSQTLLDEIEKGCSLSAAADKEQAVFGSIYPALIAMGEETGDMITVFETISDSVISQIETRQKMRQLLIYPLFVGLILLGMIAFLMVYVVPELVSFIELAGQDLPTHTLVLIQISDFLTLHWLKVLLFLPISLFLAWYVYQSLSVFRATVDRWVLTIPLFGTLFLKIKLTRFCVQMSVLMRARINLLEALELSLPMLDNLRLERAIRDARLLVLQGSSLSAAMQIDDIFPDFVTSLISIGESSDELTGMFGHISEVYQREVHVAMAEASELINPLLMIVVGGLLLWVVMSVLSPVYNAVVSVGGI